MRHYAPNRVQPHEKANYSACKRLKQDAPNVLESFGKYAYDARVLDSVRVKRVALQQFNQFLSGSFAPVVTQVHKKESNNDDTD